jgi:rod shape-determining protein MreD
VTPASPLVVAARTSLVVVVALTFQLAIASQMDVLGVQGDLMLLVAIAAGLATGPDRGATLGFAAGVAYDLLLQTPFGLSALTYAMVAYLAGSLQASMLRAAWWIPVATAAAASAVGVILYGVFGTVVGEELLGWSLLRIAGVVSVLNAIVAPIVVRAVRWATATADPVRRRPVFRS